MQKTDKYLRTFLHSANVSSSGIIKEIHKEFLRRAKSDGINETLLSELEELLQSEEKVSDARFIEIIERCSKE